MPKKQSEMDRERKEDTAEHDTMIADVYGVGWAEPRGE